MKTYIRLLLCLIIFTSLGCKTELVLYEGDVPEVSIRGTSIFETDSGETKNCLFIIELKGEIPTNQTVSVRFNTANGTAQDQRSDNDYISFSTNIEFTEGGAPYRFINIQVNGDDVIETDEIFYGVLSKPVNCELKTKKGIGGIINDDIAITSSDISVTEGNGPGNILVNVEVELSQIPLTGRNISIDWATADNTAVDSGVNPDYVSDSGTLTFTSGGEIKQDIVLIIRSDGLKENDEIFFVNFTNPVNGILQTTQVSVTIQNDDAGGLSVVPTAEIAEGQGGTESFLPLTVTLGEDPLPGNDVTVSCTAYSDSALEGSDFEAFTQDLTFSNGGPYSQDISLKIFGDNIPESHETFYVLLETPVNSFVAQDRTDVTILNDDIEITAAAVSSFESSENNLVPVKLQVTLSQIPLAGVDISVDWATADDSATTADNDYVADSGTITFTSDGSDTYEIYLFVYGDKLKENDESFYVNFSNVVNGILLTPQVSVTITNDDGSGISIQTDAEAMEGDVGTDIFIPITLTLTEEPIVGFDISVTCTAYGLDADGGTDFEIFSQALTFTNGGPLTQNINLKIFGDNLLESDESFYVLVENPVNTIISQNRCDILIYDNDGASTRLVDPTSDGGGEDGLTWATAYHTVQPAVDDVFANGGGEVWVAAATYTNGGGTGSICQLQDGVYIYGGFEGYNTGAGLKETFKSQRDHIGNVTILDGENSANNIVVGSGTCGINGFVVTGGYAVVSPYRGAGMYNDTCSPKIYNCIFRNNYADQYGGGVFNKDSNPVIINCQFIDNGAGSDDVGGIMSINSPSIIMNSTFSGNTGQGVWCNDGSPSEIRGCIFINNTSGLRVDFGSHSAVDKCFFGGNEGSGIGVVAGTNVDITNCVFSSNEENAIVLDEGTHTVYNCTVYNNTGNALLIADAVCSVTNSIFWGNGPINEEIKNTSSTVSISYSNIRGSGSSSNWNTDYGYDLGSNIDEKPLFFNAIGPDNINGTADDDLRIFYDSPGVDEGTAVGMPSDDFDGNSRPLGIAYDIGAYECPVVSYPGRIIFVNSSATGLGTGLSWADAYTAIQQALTEAVGKDQIWVAQGTYIRNGSDDYILILKNGVKLYGGFQGSESSLSERINPSLYPTILDNQGNSRYTILTDENGFIDGFTITGSSEFTSNYGGGIYIEGDSLEIRNCIFENLEADRDGGALYCNTGILAVYDCIISGSFGDLGTGGFSIADSDVDINSCVFINNISDMNSAAIEIEYVSGTISNTRFLGNKGDYRGGAMRIVRSDDLKLVNCEFSGNIASDVISGRGGGVYIEYSSPLILNCSFVCNKAVQRGGAVYNGNEGSPIMKNCIVYGNFAKTAPNVWNEVGSYPAVPSYYNCDIEESGGSSSWDSYFGNDLGGNIDDKPEIVDPYGPDSIVGTLDDDLRLFSYSPCIDSAIDVGIYTDINGNGRPSGSGYDMGAYEDPVFGSSKIIYVDIDALGAEDGSSWSDAFISIKSALAAAKNNDQVWIAEGTYFREGTDNYIVRMKYGVEIYGGFRGNESSLAERGDVWSHPTDIDGQNIVNHIVFGGDNSYMNGIRVQYGKANGSGDDAFGGGMFNSFVWPVVENCIFQSCYAHDGGGSVYNRGSMPIFKSCSFYGGVCDGNGGSIYNFFDGSPIIDNCLFLGNWTWGYGGAIYNYDYNNLHIKNTTFKINTAYTGKGGALFHQRGETSIENCRFEFNKAPNIGAVGMGDDNCAIIDCYFTGNRATTGGCGALSISSPTLVIAGCVFYGNTADIDAGAVWLGDPMTLINCTFWGNKSGRYGGAIGCTTSTFYLINSLLWENKAATDYNEVYNGSYVPSISYSHVSEIDTGDPQFVNVPEDIVWTDSNGTVSTVEITDAGTYIQVNDIIEYNDDGIARIVTSVSGTTVTFTPDLSSLSKALARIDIWGVGHTDVDEDLSLEITSSCIDAGDNTAIPADTFDIDDDLNTVEQLPLDAAGNSRFVDVETVPDTGNGSAPVVDIGAYETQ